MTDILGFVEKAVAELPEAAGKALSMLGTEVDKLGKELQTLAARMDGMEAKEKAEDKPGA